MVEVVGSIYADVSKDFQRGVFPIARTIKASSADLSVIYRGGQDRIVASRGRGDDNKQRLEINKDGISNALTTVQTDNMVMNARYRIRKLTPLECWRLMGFTDIDFERAAYGRDSEFVRYATALEEKCEMLIRKRALTKDAWKEYHRMMRMRIMSNSQLYKQAGNSIVKDVLMAIFSQLNIKGITPWNDIHNDI